MNLLMKQKNKNKCITDKCKRSREGNNATCRSCRYKKEKDNDLVAWSYRTLKANAKRRGKDFTLTLDQFREFCFETELMTNRGRKSLSFTVDRIENNKGYHIDNIQVLTLKDNLRKEKILQYDYKHPEGTKVVEKVSLKDEDYPF